MRIISGSVKGRRLRTPKDASTTRPLPDRVRTAVFNMLVGHLEDQAVLDVFAGTGSFGLEALSRGARWCHFVERDRDIARMLERNIEELGFADCCSIHKGDALGISALARAATPLHVVLFDPPYDLMRDQAQRARVFDQFARSIELLDDEGFALLRTPWPFIDFVGEDENTRRLDISLEVNGAIGPETHAYGSTAVHWYMRRREGDASELGGDD